MKKLTTLFLSVIFALSTLSAAFASIEVENYTEVNEDFKVTYEQKEIKDLDELHKRAKNKVSDLDLKKVKIN